MLFDFGMVANKIYVRYYWEVLTMTINEKLLNKCLDKIIDNKYVFSTVIRVESGDGSFVWTGARGEMNSDSKYFIASVTKLYVTAVIMSLIEQGKFSLDDKITKYLENRYIDNLHILKGVDYSKDITVKHLISNTSGIPDYFFHKENGKTAVDSFFNNEDIKWELDKTIEYVKKMKPNFAPGQKGKVSYSDTNYQLLGKIIETVTDKDITAVFKDYIFDVLGLKNTYVFNDVTDNAPVRHTIKTNQ